MKTKTEIPDFAVLFGDGFHEKRIHLTWRADVIGPILMEFFNPTSYIDVGCSVGEFCKWFHDRDVDSWGVEGPWFDVDQHFLGPKDRIMLTDLTDTLLYSFPRKDLLTCFMTVGRIPEDFWLHIAAVFSRSSDTIVTVVENGKKWAQIMADLGYEDMKNTETLIKASLEPYKDHTAIRSFYNCLQVFRRMN